MNRDEAAEILEYLLEAACELDEAKAAAAVLEDRDKDAATLKELIIKLNSELLQTIYERFGHDRFGDLIPFKRFPRSTVRSGGTRSNFHRLYRNLRSTRYFSPSSFRNGTRWLE